MAADVDRSYISEIELAKNSVSIDILEQIALALEALRAHVHVVALRAQLVGGNF